MLSTFFKPIILQRPFCAIAGVLGGLLLTQAVNYELVANSGGRFVPRTYVQWQKDTGMTKEEIHTALAIAVERGLMETQEDDPEIIRFRVNHKVVDAKLAGIGEVVEPEKKEEVVEQLPLPVAIPQESNQIVVAGPKTVTKKKTTKPRSAQDLEIDRIFLPIYMEHKLTTWTKHQWIPSNSMKAIKRLIEMYPDDAPQKFVDALIWAREGDKSTDWCRSGQWDLDNLCTNEKLFKYSDAHATAMENNPEYKARVEGGNSKDIGRAVPGVDKSQIAQGQKALNSYTKQQESAPKIVFHAHLWENKNDNS